MSAKSNIRTQAIQIDANVHAALLRLIGRMSESAGKRVTIRSVVESALLAQHPELRLSEGVASDVGGVEIEGDGKLFDILLGVVFCGSDSTASSNDSIERLEGAAVGSYGQEIRLRDLAYHLRGASDRGEAIGSMGELIRAYEAKR